MVESLAKCINVLQERHNNVLEAKPNYRDDLDLTLPLNQSDVSKEPTKKTRCLQRAKRIDQSLRFEAKEELEEMTNPLSQEEGLMPRKVVRFRLENNKIFEPKKKPLAEKEGLSKVEGKEEVVRVKIKMTKQEPQRLSAKCKNDIVFGFRACDGPYRTRHRLIR